MLVPNSTCAATAGCGKTLAFVLPIIETCNSENPVPDNGRRAQGRKPLVCCLAGAYAHSR
jgi:ATP-dependent RNA helicase DDX21